MANNFIGQPIRSLQKHLREISAYYDSIPPVVADGAFGEKTKAAVEAFQVEFDIKKTGEVDLITWRKIVEVKTRLAIENNREESQNIYPSDNRIINEGEEDEVVYIIQSMLKSLSKIFNNFVDVDITGINDEKTVESIMKFKEVAGLKPTKQINREFWNMLTMVYDLNVSNISEK